MTLTKTIEDVLCEQDAVIWESHQIRLDHRVMQSREIRARKVRYAPSNN